MICVSSFFIGIGILGLIGRDFFWRLHVWQMRSRGIVFISRTSQWEINQILGSIGSIIFGIVIFLLYLANNS